MPPRKSQRGRDAWITWQARILTTPLHTPTRPSLLSRWARLKEWQKNKQATQARKANRANRRAVWALARILRTIGVPAPFAAPPLANAVALANAAPPGNAVPLANAAPQGDGPPGTNAAATVNNPGTANNPATAQNPATEDATAQNTADDRGEDDSEEEIPLAQKRANQRQQQRAGSGHEGMQNDRNDDDRPHEEDNEEDEGAGGEQVEVGNDDADDADEHNDEEEDGALAGSAKRRRQIPDADDLVLDYLRAKATTAAAAAAADDDDEQSQDSLENIIDETRVPTGTVKVRRDRYAQDYAAQHPPDFESLGWGASWEGVPLGKGGMGVVMLHIRRNAHDAIVDRVAVKDTYVPHNAWTRFDQWDGNAAEPTERTHIEIKCMEVIKDRPGSENCVRIRGTPEVDDARLFYRICMEYCPHKSLQYLIADKKGGYYGTVDNRRIPEPVIWSFFTDLVNACLLLHHGGVDASEAVPGWKSIVHRDIKLDNIWLDAPDIALRFPSYPKARLGDFGLAIRTSDTDLNNPLAYNDDVGTPNWKAPEQLPFVDKDTMQPSPIGRLGGRTNIWGIGAAIIRLMRRDAAPSGPSFGTKIPDMPKLGKGVCAFYSDELCSLVRQCVQFKPNDRPTLRDLKRQIAYLTDPGSVNDLAQGMRDQSCENSDSPLHFAYHQDDYRIESAHTTSSASGQGS
ncbi:hypothetical protein LTR37_011267 [Vermiconidia calcicola]|uniref:Uncharacterized protein n=1 Tax=Vermiconidia calcicola TaxID=1690605 RepID=A0ACC3N2B9_9PEZI|nr:hypothetical protein LTR37_011267 [Vermiconidia calcicola]